MSERKSILCPNCRKLISRDEPACPYCGLTRPGLHNTAGTVRKIFFGANPVMAIIYINIAFYVVALFLDPQGIFGAARSVCCRLPARACFSWGPAGLCLSWVLIVSGL